jgi:hypothetical protein
MANLDRKHRFNAANNEAWRLGYRIEVEVTANLTIYTAFAHPINATEPTEGRFLCKAESSLAALEGGVEILRG